MKNIQTLIAIVFTFYIAGCNAQSANKITVTEFEKKVKADSVQLLDVRTAAEFNSGHLQNASWANWNDAAEFERRTSYFNKQKPIYVYCLSGSRSAAAANNLRKKGFTIYELQGGINAWKAGNKLVEGKVEAPQMTLKDYETLTKNSKPVLVDFGANWCPPCKVMYPIIALIEQKYMQKLNVVKIDASIHEDVMRANNITALPVFIIYKNGKEIWRKDGIATQKEIETALKL